MSIVTKALMLITIFVSPYLMAAVNTVNVPLELQQWQGWVIDQHPELKCSFNSKAVARQCQWHSPLTIDIAKNTIVFSQDVLLEKQEWIMLPGSTDNWPQQLFVNGQAKSVMRFQNSPALLLEPGQYAIKGLINSNNRASSLTLPSSTTFIDLTIDGKVVSRPNINGNRLLLTRVEPTPLKSADSVTVQVYRLIRDGYPLFLETQLNFSVSGEQRVERFGQVLPTGFEITDIRSALALHIKADGNMQVQLKPGRHTMTIKARLVANQNQFTAQANENWPKQELWSFAPDRSYRIVDVQGSVIDSSQTNMPKAWQSFSSYLVTPEKGLNLVERSRGDENPQQHNLRLDRSLWLNFSGDYFTTQENIQGSLGHLDRLSAQGDYKAGRVSINTQPVLITSINNDQGVEVLPGVFNLQSVGDIKSREIIINPWNTDLSSASLRLNLPPGFSVFSVQGADSVTNDYLSDWNLWEIFIVILFVVVLFKQYGIVTSIAGLLYALVTHKIQDAPSVLLLLAIVGFHFVINVLPKNRIRSFSVKLYQLSLVVVVLSFLPFAVQQVRLSIYPQLEKSNRIQVNSNTREQVMFDDSSNELMMSEMQSAPLMLEKSANKLRAMSSSKEISQKDSYVEYDTNYQENEVIQTGPGMPSWQWNYANINLTSPVVSGQKIQIMIIPPWLNRILHLLSVLMFVLLAWLFFKGQKGQDLDNADTPANKIEVAATSNTSAAKLSVTVLALLISLSVLQPQPAMASFPDQSLLDEYYQRLSAKDICYPDCVAINQLLVTTSNRTITLKMKVFAINQSALPLPINLADQLNVNISVDAQPVKALSRESQQAALLLTKGEHDILISIDVSELSQLNLSFANNPQITQVFGDAWQVSGLDKTNINNARLQFRKIKPQALINDEKRLTPDPIKPFVKVSRVFNLDLEWQVTTTVTRIAPVSGAMNVAVTLLDGESVTSRSIKVKDGLANVSFSNSARTVSWTSDLKKESSFTLKATNSQEYYEQWRLVPSLKWHLDYQGIKPIKSGNAHLTWQPVANDSLTVNMQRPEPIEGKSVAIDQASLSFTPGDRQSQSVLELSFRASKGGDYAIELPESASITNVSLNGDAIIYVQEKGKLLLPILPGTNTVKIDWLQLEPMAFMSRTPVLDIGSASNISIDFSVPRDRWVLALKGPLIGPAVLFWGVLVVVLAIGFVLGRQQWSPLKSWQWMLLGAGVTTSFWPITLIVVLWFVVLSKRHLMINTQTAARRYQFIQIGIALLSLIMLLALVLSVAKSLMFGTPDMQVVGNGSYASSLHWYQDTVSSTLPQALVISVPMWSYQLLMLLWSIWLSISLIGWLKWGWGKYSDQGLWKSLPKKQKKAKQNKDQKNTWQVTSDRSQRASSDKDSPDMDSSDMENLTNDSPDKDS
jgi:hypothetical protein